MDTSLSNRRAERHHRLALATALCGADRHRASLAAELTAVLSTAAADRAAVVWVDEFHPDVVRPYVLLDVGHDRPLRHFPLDALVSALYEGVPGVVDVSGSAAARGGHGAFCAVALGSDMIRSWFLVADSRTPRPPLTPHEREQLLYRAGRCSGLVLHRDIDGRRRIPGLSEPGAGGPSFLGWAIIEDFNPEGASEDERISYRFVVGRLVGRVVEEGVVFPESLSESVQGARKEVAKAAVGGIERRVWEAVFDALEREDPQALAEAALALARRAETAGHFWGAAQLGAWAFELAGTVADGQVAARAASAMARVCRRIPDAAGAGVWSRVRRRLPRHARSSEVG